MGTQNFVVPHHRLQSAVHKITRMQCSLRHNPYQRLILSVLSMLTSTVSLTVFLESSKSDFNQVILVPVLKDTTMKSLCTVAFIPYHVFKE